MTDYRRRRYCTEAQHPRCREHRSSTRTAVRRRVPSHVYAALVFLRFAASPAPSPAAPSPSASLRAHPGSASAVPQSLGVIPAVLHASHRRRAFSFGPGGGIESTVTSSERMQHALANLVPHVAAEPWPCLHPAHRTPLATRPSIAPPPPSPTAFPLIRRRDCIHDGSQSRIRCVDTEPYWCGRNVLDAGAFSHPYAAQSEPQYLARLLGCDWHRRHVSPTRGRFGFVAW